MTEGDLTANLIVNLSGPSGKNITINYSLGEGSTATAGTDFVSPSGTLPIPAGSTQGSIPVVIKEDTLFEADETVFVVLSSHVNVSAGSDVTGKVTIKDDADPAVAPTVPNASVTEGNSGMTDLTFQVSLAGPRPQTTFNVRTVVGTADGPTTGWLASPCSSCGDRHHQCHDAAVHGQGQGRRARRGQRDVYARLENPTNGAVVATAIGTINNDDNNTEIQIDDTSADEPRPARRLSSSIFV